MGSGPRYITVLMAQAKIYWNRENYQMVEKIFRKSVEFCNDDDTWKLNVAHVLFMQNKYKEAIGFYEPIVKKHYDNVSFSGEPIAGSTFRGCILPRTRSLNVDTAHELRGWECSGPSTESEVYLCVQVEQCNIQECPCKCKPSVNQSSDVWFHSDVSSPLHEICSSGFVCSDVSNLSSL